MGFTNHQTLMKPEELLFAKTHEWVHFATTSGGARLATVGLSTPGVQALGEVLFVQLPEPGTAVVAGEPFGELESAKAVVDLYSPVSGEVVEVNRALVAAPAQMLADPYGAGWLIKVRLATPSATTEGLLDYATYQRECTPEQPTQPD